MFCTIRKRIQRANTKHTNIIQHIHLAKL